VLNPFRILNSDEANDSTRANCARPHFPGREAEQGPERERISTARR
jgi:hypothetical protein